MGIVSRFKQAWNAFLNQTFENTYSGGYGTSYQASKTRLGYATNRTIVSAIYTRLGIDAAAIDLFHSRVDSSGNFVDVINSELNECLTVSANQDQAARAFRMDVYTTLFDEGVVAIVPVDTSSDPEITNTYDIYSMRVGRVVGWYPERVRLEVYNERKGAREQITMSKSCVAIVENPLYAVMNEPNSTLQRLIAKINLLDAAEDTAHSGKLNIIIQLPYTVNSATRRAQAEQRRQDIEFQLTSNRYGIAYTDGTEKITQLNRSAENGLLEHIETLTKQLYAQLGLTEDVMNGTANEQTMINYYNRTIEPLVSSFAEALRRTFLTRTARTQGQSISFFRDPFRLAPIAELAEIVDKFTRNEVLTANEIRPKFGFRPSKDPKADELRNSNMPQPTSPADLERTSQNGT